MYEYINKYIFDFLRIFEMKKRQSKVNSPNIYYDYMITKCGKNMLSLFILNTEFYTFNKNKCFYENIANNVEK